MSDTPVQAQAVAVLLEDRLTTFTRAIGLLRRRNFPVHSIAVGPAATPGLSQLTVMLHADKATADRLAQYLQKTVGVRDVVAFAVSEETSRELALIKVRIPSSGQGELLDIAQLYRCAVVNEALDSLVLEVSGPEPLIRSCLRALEQFGVLEVARTGTIALDTTTTHRYRQAEPQ